MNGISKPHRRSAPEDAEQGGRLQQVDRPRNPSKCPAAPSSHRKRDGRATALAGGKRHPLQHHDPEKDALLVAERQLNEGFEHPDAPSLRPTEINEQVTSRHPLEHRAEEHA